MIESIGNDFYNETGIRLSSVSQLKLYNMLKEWDDTKFLNIWRSYHINEESKNNISYFSHYKVEEEDWWENIANKYYGSPKLWWVIALFNDVNNPFEELEPGRIINILKQDYLYMLMKEIKNIGVLGN